MSLLDALLLDPAPFNIWIAFRTDGIKGSGTISDPYDGSTQVRFDGVMVGIAGLFPNQKVAVHIGPGIFETKGYADGETTGWQPKAGMKIFGSGMDVTTLKLVSTAQNKSYFAIGHSLTVGAPAQPNLLDFFEVSDLTIDCNLADQTPVQVSCGAIRIMGNHCRIRRVKAKNWGTKYAPNRCYVLSAIIADPASGVMEVVDAGIEDCIVVEPASMPTNPPVTLIHVGGLENSTSAEGFGLSPFIRNCFLDAGSPTAGPEFRGLSMSWCRGGVIEGNHLHNLKYGGPFQNQTSTRDVTIRNNHYINVLKGPYFYLRTYPASLGTATLTRSGTSTLITAITSVDHKLFTGDRVAIVATNSAFSKWAQITVTAPNQFTYLSSASGVPGSATAIQKLFGLDRVIIEGNMISLAPATSGDLVGVQVEDLQPTNLQDPDYPAYQHGQIITRNNKIRYVDGAFQTSPPFVGYAMQFFGARNAIIQDNIVESVPANPIRHERCGKTTYFNNRTPGGVLIRGVDSITNRKSDELETEAEDALVMAMFNER